MILIPSILLIAAVVSFVKAYRQSNSGTTYISTTEENGLRKRTFTDSSDKFPIYKTGAFVFGCILLAACIAVSIALYHEQ